MADGGSKASTPQMLRGFAAQAEALASGRVTPSALLAQALDNIDAGESRLRAFVTINREAALAQAAASTARWAAGQPLSPLDGAIVAVKDIIETADMPTGQGSPLWDGFATQRDAATVQALREAGAVILGKTTTTEFASTELFAPTVNPHDPRRTPGGSSSGSAAAVGAGFAHLGLGSQVVGSTVRPASYNGCFGFKPTYGALNRGGSYDYLSQSCVGILGTTLEDVWLCARAIAARAGGDPGHPGLQGPDTMPRAEAPLRLALLRTDGWAAMTPGAAEALEGALSALRDAGVEVLRAQDHAAVAAVEDAIAAALKLTWTINAWEFRWPLGTYARLDAARISPAMRERLALAEGMTQADYAAALARRAEVRSVFASLAEVCDAAVTLAATGAAPVGFSTTGDPGFNVPASLVGVPAVSLPVLQDQNLPLGLQLLCWGGEDARLFGHARWTFDRLSTGPRR